MRLLFGDVELDIEARILRVGGSPVRVSPKAFDRFCILAAARPSAVGKQTLALGYGPTHSSRTAASPCTWRVNDRQIGAPQTVTDGDRVRSGALQFVVKGGGGDVTVDAASQSRAIDHVVPSKSLGSISGVWG
jgi:hypothetical protein